MKTTELDLTEAGSLSLHGSVEIIRHGEECPFRKNETYNDRNYQTLFELENSEEVYYGRWKITLRAV